jgi:hypothetical protein
MKTYTRSTDGATMIEIAPGQYVNAAVALALKLITPETHKAVQPKPDKRKAAA